MTTIINKEKLDVNKAYPKMNRHQARVFWATLTPEQRRDFSKMYKKLVKGELMFEKITADDNNQIQTVTLRDKAPKPKPMEPFMKFFPAETPPETENKP